jgi:hypothetical protein
MVKVELTIKKKKNVLFNKFYSTLTDIFSSQSPFMSSLAPKRDRKTPDIRSASLISSFMARAY